MIISKCCRADKNSLPVPGAYHIRHFLVFSNPRNSLGSTYIVNSLIPISFKDGQYSISSSTNILNSNAFDFESLLSAALTEIVSPLQSRRYDSQTTTFSPEGSFAIISFCIYVGVHDF